MQAKLLRPADYRTVPWKNGLGTTQEIAALRSNEDLRSGGFTWRLSVATVAASAPFSSFPGVDRIILLQEGDGMMLDSGAHGRHRLERKLEPYAFSGDWSTDCKLLGGPCRDFNVMVSRERARAALKVVTAGPEPQVVFMAGHTAAIHAVSGPVLVAGSELPPEGYEVPPEHTLLLESPYLAASSAELELRTQGGSAAALFILFAEPAPR